MCADAHDAFQGKWKCIKNEKFDDYLGKHGINYITRKLVNKVPCTVEVIKNDDGSWTVNEITAVRTAGSTYSIGVRHGAVHPVTLANVTAIVIIEGNKIISKGFAGEDSEDVVEWTSRELLEDGTMLQIIYFGDLVCKRWFVRES